MFNRRLSCIHAVVIQTAKGWEVRRLYVDRGMAEAEAEVGNGPCAVALVDLESDAMTKLAPLGSLATLQLGTESGVYLVDGQHFGQTFKYLLTVDDMIYRCDPDIIKMLIAHGVSQDALIHMVLPSEAYADVVRGTEHRRREITAELVAFANSAPDYEPTPMDVVPLPIDEDRIRAMVNGMIGEMLSPENLQKIASAVQGMKDMSAVPATVPANGAGPITHGFSHVVPAAPGGGVSGAVNAALGAVL